MKELIQLWSLCLKDGECRNTVLFYFLKYLFIYFWLHWVFVAARGLSLVREATACHGVQVSHCSGFSCCGAPALGARASIVVVPRL